MNIAPLNQLLQPWLAFLADDPALRALQAGMLFLGAVVIFLVFYAMRDILLRTHSFWYMFICIVLVALLPIGGFFLYLLIRPARTIKEREIEEMLEEIVSLHDEPKPRSAAPKKKLVTKKKEKEKEPSEELSL